MITRERLLEICEKNKIWIPNKNASLKVLITFIARWALNEEELDRKSCFGFLETDNNNCLSCDFRKSCFKLSFGIDEETYWKKIEKADRVKIEFY